MECDVGLKMRSTGEHEGIWRRPSPGRPAHRSNVVRIPLAVSINLYLNGLACRTIIFAAMDTTSNAMARTLQLLATHPDVQTKLRREIIDAKTGERPLDYDQLHNLPYLDAVCRETLRL